MQGEKHSYLKIKMLFIAVVILLPVSIMAQAFNGYTLFSQNNSRYSYLVDMSNTTVHSWNHAKNGGYSCYLLPDGTLMRSAVSSNSQLNGGGATGIVQKIAWNGSLLWEYTYSSSTYRTHHDFEPLPNGNVLLIAWEVKSASQCVAAGLNHSATLWPDHIIEVQPVGTNGGTIVWEWHFWDHLIQDHDATKANYGVVGNHPELLDINCGSTSGDWMHMNGISYDAEKDLIVMSSHNLDEVFVLDHSTTTQQAASHSGGNYGRGGDILYRWGRPSNYDAPGSQVFNVVHSSVWIADSLPGGGNIIAFNNREGQGTSMVVEITPPTDSLGNFIWTAGSAYGPTSPTWSYTASGFYSNHLGGCQRLPNGNTFIVESTSGYLFEVDAGGNTVWSYNRGGELARAFRYSQDYPGLIGIPVELISFTANVNGKNVMLDWITATEINNSGFEIQRSIDNSNFIYIGFLSGTGTSTEYTRYNFQDYNLDNGKYYYRLKQIDFDGTISFSDVVEVEIKAKLDFTLFQNYPNPFNPGTTIKYQLPVASKIVLKVYNILGKEIATLVNETKEAGTHTVNFDASSLSSGVYIYKISGNESVQTKRMILVK
jgi:hypothetical protein